MAQIVNRHGTLKNKKSKSAFLKNIAVDFIKNKYVYIMAIPVILYYLIFRYGPMYGIIIAFKNFNPSQGIFNSPWVGLKYFKEFFDSFYFLRVIKNTLSINILLLVFGFPAPIIFAMLFNEIKNKRYKSIIQTTTYLPHFISTMVVAGLIVQLTAYNGGVINDLVEMLGGERSVILTRPELFQWIYVLSDIWQEFGWGSIIYLAALSAIDVQQYEAAIIDGAGRFKQIIHVTIPGIMPTIVILLILRMGDMMYIGFEKIILLYSSATYETADVISSFIYRKGLQGGAYSYSAAVGLFNTLINFAFLIAANALSRRVSETSLW